MNQSEKEYLSGALNCLRQNVELHAIDERVTKNDLLRISNQILEIKEKLKLNDTENDTKWKIPLITKKIKKKR